MSSKAWQQFNAYDFEADEKWKDVKVQIKNGVIEFPTGMSEKDALERMKYRFYKKNVDPSFNPAKRSDEEEEATPAPTNTSQPGAAPGVQQQPQQPPRAAAAARPSAVRGPVFTVWLFAQVFHLLSCMLYIFSFGRSNGHYYRAIYAAMVTYGISLYMAFGSTRVVDTQLAANVLQNDNTHYFILCLALSFARPSFDTLIPLVLYAVLHLTSYVNNNGQVVPERIRPLFRDKAQPLINKILRNQHSLLLNAAMIEFYSALLAIFSLFFGGGVMLPLSYYWFLNLRYTYSANTRHVIGNFTAKIESFTEGHLCPAPVKWIYDKVKGFLARGQPQ